MEKIVVSIICNAYNHEKYIRQTLVDMDVYMEGLKEV